jgi:hypothetical protein
MEIPKVPTSVQDLPGWCRSMTRLARAIYPRPNGIIRPRVGAGGTTFDIDINATSRTTAAAAQTPFQVLGAPDSSDPGGLYVTFNPYSYLFTAFDIGAKATITNLMPVSPATGLSVEEGDYVWLEIDMQLDDNGNLELQGNPKLMAGAWPAAGDGGTGTEQYLITTDTIPIATAFFTPVAKIVDMSDTTPGATGFSSQDRMVTAKIIQLLFTHLLMVQFPIQTANNGQVVSYVPIACPWATA